LKGKSASLLFLGICIVLAVLLLTRALTPILSGVVFAIALAVLGLLSAGFRKK
jgi:hypothetical protein